MLRWLLGLCGRMFRQTDHESGVDVVGHVTTEAMIAAAFADVPPAKPRQDFRLAARLASASSLNIPSARAPAIKRRISSTKPTPKIVEVRPKAASRRRSVVLVSARAC